MIFVILLFCSVFNEITSFLFSNSVLSSIRSSGGRIVSRLFAELDSLPSYYENLEEQLSVAKETVEVEGKLPQIAIVGRPNTGKSSLVNKLANSFKDGPIIHDEPGITRDRTYRLGEWNGYNFQVIDTGGIIFDDKEDKFANHIFQQAQIALNEATVAVMVCDAIAGVTPLDLQVARWLRKNCKIPWFLAVNKCDSDIKASTLVDPFWKLGLGNPYPVSAIHGLGVGDLLDEITSKHLRKIDGFGKTAPMSPSLESPTIYGKERAIVSSIAGTTRDTVDVVIRRGNSTFRVIDTAGVRKKNKIDFGPEFFSVGRAFKAIRRADVALLVIDATQEISEQDQILAERIAEEGRACIILCNKWDVFPDKTEKSYLNMIDTIRENFMCVRWAEILLVSAETGLRVEKVFNLMETCKESFHKRLPTRMLNEVIKEAVVYSSPPTIGPKSGRIYYCSQVSTAPPTFVFFVNDPMLFTGNYQKYLDKKLRQAFGFTGTPIRMFFRGKTVRSVERLSRKEAVQSRALLPVSMKSRSKKKLKSNVK